MGYQPLACLLGFILMQDPPEAAAEVLVSKDNTLECALKRSSSREYSMSINNESSEYLRPRQFRLWENGFIWL